MKTAGIVAEFNPFHTGHLILVQSALQAGATHIVAVMSGNFVQRGAPAVTDKRVRARCALHSGVDLVLELPLPYACASAQHFARGAVALLQAAGCVDILAFGSESGDAQRLEALAAALDDAALSRSVKAFLQQGMTFAKARQLAAEQVLGTAVGAQLATPNNALAVEYLRAAKALGWAPELFTIPRQGAAHDAVAPDQVHGVASASYLRTVAQDFDALGLYMPQTCVAVLRQAREQGLYPADPARLETAMLAKLRAVERRALQQLPDLSEGLENRFYNAIQNACSLQELYALAKTKRYTLARIRRLALHAFLGIDREDVLAPPPYLRVLGFNRKGARLLHEMKQHAALPVDAKLLRLAQQGERARHLAKVEAAATDLYTLALPTPQPCGYEMSASGIFLKEANGA